MLVCKHTQLCSILCDPLDHSSPSSSSVHGILQARTLEGIFLTEGSNQHLLHWDADSLPLCHLGSKPEYVWPQIHSSHQTELPLNGVHTFFLCHPMWLKHQWQKCFLKWWCLSQWHQIAWRFFKTFTSMEDKSHKMEIWIISRTGNMMRFDFPSCVEHIIPLLKIHLWLSAVLATLVPWWIDWLQICTGRTPLCYPAWSHELV